jgi:cyanophycinase
MQEWRMSRRGTLALVGGGEWTEGCSFDAGLLAASGGPDIVILPTAAAYQHPERVALRAAEWFAPLGGQVEGLMVVDRPSAEDPGMAAVVAAARFVYLAGGSPLHLRAVLKRSAVFEALRTAWEAGAVVAGAGAGAMALTDPMVDPRGGALTLGLGLVDNLAVVPHFGDEHDDAHGQKLERTVAMAPAPLPVVALPDRTALIRDPDGTWRSEGAGQPAVFVGGATAAAGLGVLKG